MALVGVLRGSAQSPGVTTGAGTSVRPGQALVSGSVNPNGQVTAYWFEHGLTSSYGNFTPTNTLVGETNTMAVSNLLTGLPRNVSYNFRLVASNSAGLVTGLNAKFISRAGSNTTSSVTGGGQPLDIRQPSLELNYIISTVGAFAGPDSSPLPPFVGEVRLFAGSFAPNGWLFCHGQLLNITNYETLFNIIGTNYGGDSYITFRLPDLRGRTIVGSGPGPEGITRVIGERGGSDQIALNLTNLALHNHSLPPPDSVGGSGYTGQNFPYSNMQPYVAMPIVFWRTGVFPLPDQNTDEPFYGQISFYAGHYVLNSPMPASGQLFPINQNQALFAVVWTNYGGNGVTTFAIPDLRGRMPMGIGAGPGPTNWTLAQSAGLVNATLTSDQLPPHQHVATALGINTGSAGNGLSQSLMKPSLAVRYIICTNGFFPDRSPSGGPTPQGIGDSQMLGQINLFAGEFVPRGWLACDGQLLSIPGNVYLWSLLGTNFGGNGTTTFALPDLSSRIPVGSSNGIPGAAYGAQQTVLTTAQMPAHTHTVPAMDFDRWITSYGLSGSEAGFDGDPDADGVQNGYEWATATNPTNTTSLSGISISSAGEAVRIGFPRNTNATDVRLSLQRAGELSNPNLWTGVASNHLGVWLPPVLPVSVSEVGATNPVDVAVTDRRTNAPSGFYRLRID